MLRGVFSVLDSPARRKKVMNAFDASKVAEINAAQSFVNVNALKMSGLDCLEVPQSLYLLIEELSLQSGRSFGTCVAEALTDWIEAQTGMTILELVGIEDDENDCLPPLTLVARTT
jgi:hypothetical protein